MVKTGVYLNIEIVRKRVINKGYIPLFTEYYKNTDKLLCETKEGYLGYVTNNGLMRGDCISIVSIKNPYTIYNIKKEYCNKNNIIYIEIAYKDFPYNYKDILKNILFTINTLGSSDP